MVDKVSCRDTVEDKTVSFCLSPDEFEQILRKYTICVVDFEDFPKLYREFARKGLIGGLRLHKEQKIYINVECDNLPKILLHEALHAYLPDIEEKFIKCITRALEDPKTEYMKISKRMLLEAMQSYWD